MLSSEDRPVSDESTSAALSVERRRAARLANRLAGTVRTAPRGSDSRIGDDETHRRLQSVRNQASHSTDFMIRRELGPEWV